MADGTVEIFKEGIKKEISEVKKGLEEVLGKILEINKANRVDSKPFEVKGIKDFKQQIEANKTALKGLNDQVEQSNRLNKKLLNSEKLLLDAYTKTNKEIIKNRLEVQQLNKRAKESAVLSSKLSTEYEKQAVKLNQLRRKYKDVALTEGEASKKAKALRVQIIKLDASLKRVDGNVGQFQRRVGNYGKAMGSARKAVTSMMGAMGAVGGAYLFVSVMRDAFKRVRDFDKAMQNIAGIMRVSRSEIKDVEQEIIKVAGASIKTSNEVAKLAENLVTLGKTKSEIKDLLEPVNNLAIGLETSSGEAAEFLVQTLNAFGAGSDEASKYADTIATIRTSTTLDFQKMRDSFQYLTPISKILNKDLAYTGALVGILADNGVKAERAGRLLGTSQQKLAKEGLTLVDALEQINAAQAEGRKEIELLKLSSELFGKQSASLGIILANNTDVLEENAQAIRDNGGALDALVNEQLKSLDAKIKILDSTWESFILSIESGGGAISNFFKGAVKGATNFITILKTLNETSDSFLELVSNYYKVFTEEGRKDLATQMASKKVLKDRVELLKQIGEIRIRQSKENGIILTQAQVEEELQHLSNNKLREELKLIEEKKEKEKEVVKKEKEVVDNKIKSKKELIKYEEGSIGYLEQIIALYERAIKTSKNPGERQEFMLKNQLLREHIELLKEKDEISLKSKRLAAGDTSVLENVENEGDPLEDDFTILKQGIIDYAETLGLDGEKALEEYLKKHGKTFDKIKEFYGDLDETAKESIEKRKELENELKDSVIEFANTLWDSKIAGIDNEIQANDDKYAMLLSQVQNDDVQRALIEEEAERKRQELEKKKRKEQRKQAIFNKGVAVAEIGINTGVAIIKSVAASPLTGGLPFSAFAAAIGALQLATVLAQPIPKYAKGTDSHKGGLAVVGDGGKHEVVKTPDGQLALTPNTSTLVDLPKGTEVYPDFERFKMETTDFNEHLKIASLMTSVSLDSQKMQNYIDAQRIFDKKLLDAMHNNTKAVKESKSKLTLNVPKIDFSDLNYKNYYES